MDQHVTETDHSPKTNKVKKFFSNLKVNWHTSTKKGEYLGYREILSYSFGSSGVNGLGSLVVLTSLNSATILIGSIYKMSPFIIYLMTSLITFFSLVKTPIISTIMDNTSGEKGKFKPYLIWMGIPTMILTCLIPFVPLSWVDIPVLTLFSEPLSLAGLAIFILQILLSITWPTLIVANGGFGQTITPNTLERAKMYSFHSILSSLWPSVITILFPILSILTIQDAVTGQESLLSYRIWFPMFGISCFLISLIIYYNVKERIVVEKDYKPKIKFWDGVKSLGSNKYFWIVTLSGIFGSIRVAGNLATWINIYSLKSDVATSITTTLLGNAMVPGMLLTSFMVKKFGKKNLMLYTGFASAVLYFPMIIFPNHPVFLLGMIFLQNALAGFAICGVIMPADALDAQQLKTGERLEGFWGMFNQLILAVIWLGTGLIGPAVLRLSGMVGGADILAIDSVRFAVFRNLSIMAGLACILQTIPYLFWDLSEEKHKRIIEELKIIAMEKNGVTES
jgi:Na+/melibiose symporter-like transporter